MTAHHPNAKHAALCILVRTKYPKIEWHLAAGSGEDLVEFLVKADYVDELTRGRAGLRFSLPCLHGEGAGCVPRFISRKWEGLSTRSARFASLRPAAQRRSDDPLQLLLARAAGRLDGHPVDERGNEAGEISGV
jgi:hypothetical protein